MNRNIKIAKQLVKLAKNLIAENKFSTKWIFYNRPQQKTIVLETSAPFGQIENNNQENFEDAIVRISQIEEILNTDMVDNNKQEELKKEKQNLQKKTSLILNSYNDINEQLEQINEKLINEKDEIKIKELKKQIRQLLGEKKFLEKQYGDLQNFDINILKTRKQNRDNNLKRISGQIADIKSDINKITRMFEKNGYSVRVNNQNLILLRGNYGVVINITPIDKQKITDAFHQGAIGYLTRMGAVPYNR